MILQLIGVLRHQFLCHHRLLALVTSIILIRVLWTGSIVYCGLAVVSRRNLNFQLDDVGSQLVGSQLVVVAFRCKLSWANFAEFLTVVGRVLIC